MKAGELSLGDRFHTQANIDRNAPYGPGRVGVVTGFGKQKVIFTVKSGIYHVTHTVAYADEVILVTAD